MPEFSYHFERAVPRIIEERVQRAQRSRLPGQPRRHRGRHTLADSLHRLANRIEN